MLSPELAPLPVLLEMVKRAGELMFRKKLEVPLRLLEMAGFELGLEEWGGFEYEVESRKGARALRGTGKGARWVLGRV